jgi:hypothetical protein
MRFSPVCRRGHPTLSENALLSEELAPGVGPELLHHIKQSIKADLLSPLARCVAQGAVLRWIVEIGNTGGDGVSSQLRGIELAVTAVATRDDLATDRVPSPLPKATFSLGEVTGVLMESHGEQGLSRKVANCLVGKRSSIVFAKRFCPLPEMRILFLRHRESCKDPGYEEGRGIERIVHGDLKLSARRQRLELRLALVGPVVRNNPKDVILADLTVLLGIGLAGLGLLRALILWLRCIGRRRWLRHRWNRRGSDSQGNQKAVKGRRDLSTWSCASRNRCARASSGRISSINLTSAEALSRTVIAGLPLGNWRPTTLCSLCRVPQTIIARPMSPPELHRMSSPDRQSLAFQCLEAGDGA